MIDSGDVHFSLFLVLIIIALLRGVLRAQCPYRHAPGYVTYFIPNKVCMQRGVALDKRNMEHELVKDGHAIDLEPAVNRQPMFPRGGPEELATYHRAFDKPCARGKPQECPMIANALKLLPVSCEESMGHCQTSSDHVFCHVPVCARPGSRTILTRSSTDPNWCDITYNAKINL